MLTHRSEAERFVLVHNGVIENYLEIKEEIPCGSPLQGTNRYENRRSLDWKNLRKEDGLSVLEAKKALIIRGSYTLLL